MPWIPTDANPDCPAWAVVKEDTGELVACHDTEEQALAQIAALNAQEVGSAKEPVAASANPMLTERAASALDALLDYHRKARTAAAVMVDTEGEVPVVDEEAVDAVEEAIEEEVEAPSGLIAAVVPADPMAVAVDGGLPPEELHVTLGYFGDAATAPPELTDALAAWLADTQQEPFTAKVSGVAVMGNDTPPATALLLEAPEFEALRASVAAAGGDWLDMEHPHFTPHMTLGYGIPIPTDLPAEVEMGGIAVWGAGEQWTQEDAMIASAAIANPPASWFERPVFSAATPLTVTEEGRVFGHAAAWDTCHIGLPGCTTAPRSQTDYAFFKTGEVVTADGGRVPVGQITMGAGHAPLDMSPRQAAAHYDNVATAVADVNAGEDEFGIWVAGALRPGVTPEQVHALRASAVSGDWRWIGKGHEMVGLLAVNVPGFPIPRKPLARVASGGRVDAIVADFTQCREERAIAASGSRFTHPSYRKIADGIAARIGRDPESRRRALTLVVHPDAKEA
jgi:hypothetical protein